MKARWIRCPDDGGKGFRRCDFSRPDDYALARAFFFAAFLLLLFCCFCSVIAGLALIVVLSSWNLHAITAYAPSWQNTPQHTPQFSALGKNAKYLCES